MNKQISKEQIQDWSENPVTEYLAELVQSDLEEIQDTPVSSALFHGEPQKTQENLIGLEEREMAWAIMGEILKGDWSYFEEVDDE